MSLIVRTCFCSMVIALLAPVPGHAGELAAPAGVQACTTRCQSQFTDCVLACDGAVPCEQACKVTVSRCVEQCRRVPASSSDSAQ